MSTTGTSIDSKIAELVRQVGASKEAIATERDKLRDLFSDLEALLESTNRGLELLDSACDTFSEYA